MGMAASQARFLNLTARKTNIEYEGQQINQQRTTLSNQSANLYNQMLTLSVPTPPNSKDFTRIQYSFTMPSLETANVSQITKIAGTTDQYTVSFTYTSKETGFPACTSKQESSPHKYSKGTTITYKDASVKPGAAGWYTSDDKIVTPAEITNATEIEEFKTKTKQDFDPNKQSLYKYSYGTPATTEYFIGPKTTLDSNVNYTGYNIGNEARSVDTYTGKFQNLTMVDSLNPPKEHKDAYDQLCNGTLPGGASDILYFVNVGTDSSPLYHYYKKSELDEAEAAGERCSYYYVGEVEEFKKDSFSPCYIERDANNRVVGFTYKDDTYAVTTSEITDQDAYDDAMNEYTYKSYLYEQEMSNINARTSILQAQDKNLELRLKQLDTEQSAIKTEMDAVSSVLKDNIEKSFKTFA